MKIIKINDKKKLNEAIGVIIGRRLVDVHPTQNGIKIIEVHHQKENLPITEVKGVSISAMENQRNNQSSTTTETQNTQENDEKDDWHNIG